MTIDTVEFVLWLVQAVQRTISMPASLAMRLTREAKRRRKSFSAAVTDLIEGKAGPLPYAGIIEDDPELSRRVDEVLLRRVTD